LFTKTVMKPKLHMCSLNFQKHMCVSYFNNIDTIILLL